MVGHQISGDGEGPGTGKVCRLSIVVEMDKRFLAGIGWWRLCMVDLVMASGEEARL